MRISKVSHLVFIVLIMCQPTGRRNGCSFEGDWACIDRVGDVSLHPESVLCSVFDIFLEKLLEGRGVGQHCDLVFALGPLLCVADTNRLVMARL